MKHPKSVIHPASEAERAAREEAIECAIDTHGACLFEYIMGITQDYHLAEDLLQSLWLNVLDVFELDEMMNYALLRNKAHDLAVDYFRKKGVEQEFRLREWVPMDLVEGNGIFAEPETKEGEQSLKDTFWNLFEGVDLTEKEKDAFWLKERYGNTINEVAEHMRVPPSTVHRWITKVKTECKNHRKGELV